MDEQTRRAIVAEIAAATRIRTKQSWEFDVDDYLAQAPGVSHQRAFDILMGLARAGELKTALVSHNGKQRRVWWRAGDPPTTE